MQINWKRNIALFLTSQTISLFGTSLVQYAITWYITLNTQSGIMITISIICGFLPTFFLSPFAGVWADRYNRKMLIILSDSIIAVSTLVLAILFFMGYNALWLLFLTSGIRALGSAVQTPSISAILPQIVPQDKLMKTNATLGSVQSFIMLISPMVSGALLSIASIQVIFLIDVVTAAAAVLVFLMLNITVHEKALKKQKSSYFSDMKLGAEYIKNHAYIKRFFIFCAIFFFLVTQAAFLTPLQVARSFGNDVWRLTAIEIVFSAGMIVGGLIMTSWGGFKNRIYTMTLSALIIGAFTAGLGIMPIFWLYLVFMGIIGVAIPIFNTPSNVLIQEKVEENFLGRVFGVLVMISSSVMPLGMLVFGPLSDVIKIEWLLIPTGILLLVQGIFLIKNKVLVEAGRPFKEPV